MTTLAESLVTLIPCSPLKKWPFLPYMLHHTQSAGGMEPFLFLETPHSYKILAPLGNLSLSQASVLFSSLPILSPQEVFTGPITLSLYLHPSCP